MNKDNAHLFLPLVQAMKEGKTIQFESREGEFKDLIDPAFDSYPPDRFRVKPEPPKSREFFVSIRSTGDIYDIDETLSDLQTLKDTTVIRVREIID